jgi:hypothetical protein
LWLGYAAWGDAAALTAAATLARGDVALPLHETAEDLHELLQALTATGVGERTLALSATRGDPALARTDVPPARGYAALARANVAATHARTHRAHVLSVVHLGHFVAAVVAMSAVVPVPEDDRERDGKRANEDAEAADDEVERACAHVILQIPLGFRLSEF